MRHLSLSVVLLLALASCRRSENPETRVNAENELQNKRQPVYSERAEMETSAIREAQNTNATGNIPSSNALKAKATELVLSRTLEGKMTADSMAALESLAPALIENRILTTVLSAVPDDQLHAFKGAILQYLIIMKPAPVMNLHPEYENTVRLALDLHEPAVAEILLEHLPKLPTYYFPEKAVEYGPLVFDETTIEHLKRGTQGLVAKGIVRVAQEDVMVRFREQLRDADPQRQRVMVWALGESPDLADFELLWSLRDKMTAPGVADTLKHALNAIPDSMERVGEYPNDQTNRTGMTKVELEKMAIECRSRLKVSNLLLRFGN